MALIIIAHRVEDEEILDLRKTFIALDEDQDGILTFSELQSGLRSLGAKIMEDELAAMLKEMDLDCNSCIDYTEFLAATISIKHYDQEGQCKAAFRAFDAD